MMMDRAHIFGCSEPSVHTKVEECIFNDSWTQLSVLLPFSTSETYLSWSIPDASF